MSAKVERGWYCDACARKIGTVSARSRRIQTLTPVGAEHVHLRGDGWIECPFCGAVNAWYAGRG